MILKRFLEYMKRKRWSRYMFFRTGKIGAPSLICLINYKLYMLNIGYFT